MKKIPMNQFTYEQALDFYSSLDNYFDSSWWFAIKTWMDHEGFLSFPASTKYHMRGDGGLLIHSMHVVRNAMILNRFLNNEVFGAWEIAAAGTFHDLGKMGVLLEDGTLIPMYKRLDEGEAPKVEGQRWKYNVDCPKISPTSYSLAITRKFVHLPFHIEEAISHHDGLYIPENQNRAHREGRLELLIHYADYWAGHVNEDGEGDRSTIGHE